MSPRGLRREEMHAASSLYVRLLLTQRRGAVREQSGNCHRCQPACSEVADDCRHCVDGRRVVLMEEHDRAWDEARVALDCVDDRNGAVERPVERVDGVADGEESL